MRWLLSAILTIAVVGNADAFGSDDRWTAGWGQGIAEAVIGKGPGNQIYVTCDEGAGRNATGISFMLAGKAPTGAVVTLTFDNADPHDFSLWDGAIRSDCHACASTYDVVIDALKKHSSVHVRFENGDAARFTLKGSSAAIGHCIADFYR